MKRVLLLYISVNSGHHIAAKSIENALLRLDDQMEVLNVNALNYISPILEKFVLKTYMGVVKNNPELWEYLYDNTSFKQKISKFRDLAYRLNSNKLIRLVSDFKPDVVACTQAYPCGVLSSFKGTNGARFPLMGIITDYIVHSYWVLDHVDLYVVPTEMTKMKLLEQGVQEDRIRVLGIPVDPVFNKKLDRNLLKEWYGIPKDHTVILIMGGGQGLIPIREIIFALQEIRSSIHVIAVTGKNRKLRKQLEEARKKCRVPLTVFGYVNEIDELMQMADLLISKPGGLTTSEALVKRLPMLIFKPLPGQESKNTEFLVENKVALKADDVDEIPKIINRLLKNPSYLQEIHQSIEQFRKPQAAVNIAKAMMEF